MAGTYGGGTLPVSVVEDPERDAISDPGLRKLLEWAKAVIEYECADGWSSIAPGEEIVRHIHPHDPRECDLENNSLPALFAFSGDIKPVKFEDGSLGRERTISLLWVFPPSSEVERAERSGILAGLQAALHVAIDEPPEGRHPAWVDDGDTDTYASTYGSSLLVRGGFEKLHMEEARNASVEREIGDRQRVIYPAVNIDFNAQEFYVPSSDWVVGDTIVMTINQNPDDPAFIQTEIEPD